MALPVQHRKDRGRCRNDEHPGRARTETAASLDSPLTARPLVSILTPVYNGDAFLAQCIDSVLAQTYEHWECVLVDNASTDRTAEILRDYAARDARIRVHTNAVHVPVIPNHNIVARLASPEAAWCKFLCADDALFPDCLERMVTLGLTHPPVGLISAYQLRGTDVGLGGLPYPSPVTDGRTIGRMSLLGNLSVFGGPSAHMIRADFVRARDPFYDESNLHADVAACYDVLESSDFGFVHQVLTFARPHRGSLTHAVARRLNTFLLGHVKILATYGPRFLTTDEYAAALAQRMDAYYKFLARVLLTPGHREMWRYHRDGLQALGMPVNRPRLARVLCQQLGQVATSPGRELPKLVRLLRRAGSEDANWHYWWAPTGFEAVHTSPSSAATNGSTARPTPAPPSAPEPAPHG
jgi:glycosyltransferase involved in cell wall biosynthesis